MLIHELVVRGVAVDDSKTVEVLRSTLRPLFKLERTGSFNYPPYALKFQEEKVQIRAFLDAAIDATRTLSGESAQHKFLTIQSRLVHLLHRTTRIPVSQLTPEEESERADLLVGVLAGLDSLETACRQDPELSLQFPESDGDLPPQHNLNSTTYRPVQSVSQPPSEQPAQSSKSPNIEKWNLRFSGDNKKLSVHGFLERVNELRLARNITYRQLFDSAIDLFEGKALNWFRANRTRFNDWNGLAELLQTHFSPPDYKSRLFREILDRTQDTSESIVDYLSSMQALFRRYVGLSEAVQLDILCRNLSPFYSTQLPDVDTIEELEEECLKLETKKYRVESYVPPSRKRHQFVEPDFAFVEVESRPSSSTEPVTSQQTSVNEVSPPTRSNLVCWNCQAPGHLNRNCPNPKKTHCYRCGTPNVTVRTCTKCSNSGNDFRRNR